MSEIKVTITDERGSSKSITHSVSQVDSTKMNNPASSIPSTSEGKQNAKTSNNMVLAMLAAQKTASYVTSNIGKWTGNSHIQDNITNLQQTASLGRSALVSPALAIAEAAFNIGATAIDNSWELKRERYTSNQQKAKAGELVGRRH